jgi:choline dehydrogenase
VAYSATQDLHTAMTSNGIAEAGLFLHSDLESEENPDVAPDLEIIFASILLTPSGHIHSRSGFMGIVALTHPENTGSVSLRSADPQAAPIIQMNYLQSESDVQKLVGGIKLIRKLFQAIDFDEFRGEEVAPGVNVQSDEALVAYIRAACSTFYHPVGTCKMGSDPMAVVDSELRVYGIEGLRVVDASIMPIITTGNTNAPTIAIAEKAADLIKARSSVSTKVSSELAQEVPR